MMEFVSAYLHIPFCQHRCYYCDFNTYAGLDEYIPKYVEALKREVETLGRQSADSYGIKTIFFGGGTPSLLATDHLEGILRTIKQNFQVDDGVEVTLEANPGTVSLDYFEHLRVLGVNRISLGVQSSSPENLTLLGRTHSFEDAIHAFFWARQAGFDNLSIDMIMGLPHQDLDQWKKDLEQCINLEPEHISIYSLIIESGTPFDTWIDKGRLVMPDDDVGADIFIHTMDYLANLGYEHYEISNWAKAGRRDFRSAHNLQYWKNQPYFGFGAGSHGFIHGVRTANLISPHKYIQQMNGQTADFQVPRTAVTQEINPVSREDEIKETLMMGLRLIEDGVSAQAFQARFGESLDDHYGDEIHALMKAGLLYWKSIGDDRCLCLTKHGTLLGNQVFMQFI